MKWIKGKIIFILIGIIAIGFTMHKIQDATYFKNTYSLVSIRLRDKEITGKQLKEATKEEESDQEEASSTEITAWKRIDRAEIKNSEFGRKETVSVILTNGNMHMTIPMALLSGNYVYQDDKKGCVIDSNTAYKLFGTENPLSGIVTYEKKEYIIRGIVKAESPVFLIQGESDKVAYSNLSFMLTDKEKGEMLAREFLIVNGLNDYVLIDEYFYSCLIHSLLTLPVWIFFMVVVFYAIKYYYRYYMKLKHSIVPKKFFIFGIFLIITVLGYTWLLYQFAGNPFYLPEKLIPTKWSNFDFWTQQYRNFKDQIHEIRYLTPNPRDILLVDELLNLSFNICLLVLLYGFLLYLLKHYINIKSPLETKNQ